MAKKSPRTSVRAFAKLLGVSHVAVVKAIAAGRLQPPAVGRDRKRKPFVADVEMARQQWEDNASKPTKVAAAGEGKTAALADVQREVAIERAQRLRFDNEVRRGRYMLVEDAQRTHFESARIVREGLLNLPSRLSAELAAESDERKIFTRLDEEIRAALSAIADRLEQAS